MELPNGEDVMMALVLALLVAQNEPKEFPRYFVEPSKAEINEMGSFNLEYQLKKNDMVKFELWGPQPKTTTVFFDNKPAKNGEWLARNYGGWNVCNLYERIITIKMEFRDPIGDVPGWDKLKIKAYPKDLAIVVKRNNRFIAEASALGVVQGISYVDAGKMYYVEFPPGFYLDKTGSVTKAGEKATAMIWNIAIKNEIGSVAFGESPPAPPEP